MDHVMERNLNVCVLSAGLVKVVRNLVSLIVSKFNVSISSEVFKNTPCYVDYIQ